MFLSKRLSTCALCNENWVWILLLILNSMRRMRVLLWNKIYLGAFEFAGVPGLICSLWSSHLFFPFDKAKHVGEKQTALNVHFYWNCVPFPDKTWMFSRPWKKGRKPASWKVTVSESGRLQTGECEWIVEQQNGNLPHVAMVGKRQENAAKNLLSDVCLVFTVCVPTMGIGRCTIDKQVEREQI